MRDKGVPCTVTFDRAFDEDVEALRGRYPRIDEMVRGAEWALARTELRGDVEVGLYPGGGGSYLVVEATVTDSLAVAARIKVQ